MFRLFVLTTLLTYGNGFVFETSTHEIHPRLTHTMAMRCALNGSLPSPLHAKTDDDVKAADRVTHVTSITVSRDGNDVATVTKFDPAKTMLDQGGFSELRVIGSVGDGVGENGHLDLVWKYPVEEQAGVYSCEVSGITDHGHCVSFSRSLSINYTATPTIDDLVSHIYEQQKVISEMHTTIHDLKKASEAKDNLSMNIQTGNIDLGSSSNWGRSIYNSNRKIESATVKFAKVYSSPPVVTLSLSHFKTANNRVSFDIKLVNVDETGFNMSCENLNNGYYTIESMSVNWMSFPTKL